MFVVMADNDAHAGVIVGVGVSLLPSSGWQGVVAKSAARDEIADAQRGERFKISKAEERNISGYISA